MKLRFEHKSLSIWFPLSESLSLDSGDHDNFKTSSTREIQNLSNSLIFIRIFIIFVFKKFFIILAFVLLLLKTGKKSKRCNNTGKLFALVTKKKEAKFFVNTVERLVCNALFKMLGISLLKRLQTFCVSS